MLESYNPVIVQSLWPAHPRTLVIIDPHRGVSQTILVLCRDSDYGVEWLLSHFLGLPYCTYEH